MADYLQLKLSVEQVITKQMIYSSPGHTFGAASKIHQLIGLSATISGDAAFARQARRKYL